MNAAALKGVESGVAVVSTKLDQTGTSAASRMDSFDLRIAGLEADATRLLTNAGFPPQTSFHAIAINDRLYLYSDDMDLTAQMKDWKLVRVKPYFEAFEAPLSSPEVDEIVKASLKK